MPATVKHIRIWRRGDKRFLPLVHSSRWKLSIVYSNSISSVTPTFCFRWFWHWLWHGHKHFTVVDVNVDVGIVLVIYIDISTALPLKMILEMRILDHSMSLCHGTQIRSLIWLIFLTFALKVLARSQTCYYC